MVVSLVVIFFLLNFRSALVPIIALPIAVVISFIPMYFLKLSSNIMSLGGDGKCVNHVAPRETTRGDGLSK